MLGCAPIGARECEAQCVCASAGVRYPIAARHNGSSAPVGALGHPVKGNANLPVLLVGWAAKLLAKMLILSWCWWWAGRHWRLTMNPGGMRRFEENHGARQSRSARWGGENCQACRAGGGLGCQKSQYMLGSSWWGQLLAAHGDVNTTAPNRHQSGENQRLRMARCCSSACWFRSIFFARAVAN